MRGKAKMIAVSVVALLFLLVVPLTAQAVPRADQIADIQQEIDRWQEAKEEYDNALKELANAELKWLNKGQMPDPTKLKPFQDAVSNAWQQIVLHGQNATDLANRYYGTNVTGAMYHPSLQDCGQCTCYPDGTIIILIGNGAFRSPGWLASTKKHEQVHREQFQGAAGRVSVPAGADIRECTPLGHLIEIEAYQAELACANTTGLNATEIRHIEEWIQWHRDRLPVTSLNVSSTAGGSVTKPGEGTFPYRWADIVELVANATAGHRFVKWTGNVSTIANPTAPSTTINMTGNYSVTANFVAVHNLTISSTDGGSVTVPGEGTFIYDEGTVVNLVAQAEEGYQFVEWTGDVSTIADVKAASTNITMNGDYYITAKFERYTPPGEGGGGGLG